MLVPGRGALSLPHRETDLPHLGLISRIATAFRLIVPSLSLRGSAIVIRSQVA